MLPAIMAHMTSSSSGSLLLSLIPFDSFSEWRYCTARQSSLRSRWVITIRDTRTMSATTNQFLVWIFNGLYSVADMTPILAGCHEP